MYQWLLILLVVIGSQEADQQHGKPLRLERWRTAKAGIEAETPGTSLRVSKGPGWIRTKNEYLDFMLRLRYRVMTPDAEGALLLRAWRPGGEGWPETGYRLGINGPAVRRPAPLITGFSGKTRVVSDSPQPSLPAAVVGEWRELVVLCRYDRLTITVDQGEIGVVEGHEPQAGAIGIEVRNGVIEFDNILLFSGYTGVGSPSRSLPGAAEPPPFSACPSGPTRPRVTRDVRARYTSEAMAAGVEGTVLLEAVVLRDGSVEVSRVVRSVHWDLDLEAIAAARRWQFKPALCGGTPVASGVRLEVSFVR